MEVVRVHVQYCEKYQHTVSSKQRDGRSFGTSTTSTADTMNVILRVIRVVIVQYMSYVSDILMGVSIRSKVCIATFQYSFGLSVTSIQYSLRI